MTEELQNVIADMLRSPRVLKNQTLRHLEEELGHLEEKPDPGEVELPEFLRRAAGELEDYRLEIIFGPVFTPSFEEQVEVAEALTRHRPTPAEVDAIVAGLAASLQSCPIVLPEGGTASLTLHEVLLERFVKLLNLESAPDPDIADLVRQAVPGKLVPRVLTLMRRRGISMRHHKWLAGFLGFVFSRRGLDWRSLVTLTDFLASQKSLERDSLLKALDSSIRASADTGSFHQRGRMYWSSDVAEHHQFRGQGIVDRAQVEKNMQDVRILESLKVELEAFGDILEAGSLN